MKFEWYLALRYFRGQRKQARFLSFIKSMAIVGVAVGSAGLLIALSIVHGFKSVIDNKVMGFAPHMTVETFTDSPVYRSDTLLTWLDRFPEIREAQAVVEGEAMVQTASQVTGTRFKGVSPGAVVTDLQQYVSRGEYDLSSDSAGMPGIVLGSSMARSLDADIGSVLTAFTAEGIPSPLNSPEIQQFRLTGVYQTGIDRFDDLLAIIDKRYAGQLFQLPGAHATAVEVRLEDPSAIDAFDRTLSENLPFPYRTTTILEQYGSIFAWVEMQEQIIPFVISVMILVAAFNLIGTILMMVIERTRDIGILKTMGTQNRQVRTIFLLEGLFVALVGLAIGFALSLGFAWVQSTWQLIPLSEQNYYMSYVPVQPHLLDFVITAGVTLALCTLATWLPARVASRTNPLNVIAYGR
ncbi:MAG: ABC transporter permease [Balneolaceae bacterium]|nr:ABC transporter permease [Balneolaceae bacterium]